MNKKIILLMAFLLIIPIISANILQISLKPHFFFKSREVLAYNNETEVDGISFEIIGKNTDEKSRIINISIQDAYPLQFKKVLPKDITSSLYIKEENTLWISQIIGISQFNQTNIIFWVGVSGINENSGEELYTESHLNLTIFNKINKDDAPSILVSLGNKVWPSNYTGGLFVIFGAIFLMGFFYWKYKGSDKLDAWRDNSEKKRIEIRQEEERW